MNDSQRPRRSIVDEIKEHWSGFWFTPRPAFTLGLVRMAFGVFTVAWTLAALPDLSGVFGERGAAPRFVLRDYQWSVFQIWPGETALLIGWILLLLSAVALTVGWHSRPAAILVFVLLYSFCRRGTYIYNSGDSVAVIIALVLALSCCGAGLSLDQRRRTGSFRSASTLAPWPIRLLQVQITVIYLSSVLAKLTSKTWADGSAIFYAWRTDGRWALLPVPEWLSSSPFLVNAITWTALLIELAVGVLVWNRRCRPWVLAMGVLLHLGIMLTLNVGFFSLVMCVLYLAFVPDDVVPEIPGRIKQWSRERRRAGAR